MTEALTADYPQIVPAAGETDTGVVVSFDCEDGTLTDTLVNPAGEKALSINPLNWKTDGTPADKSLNLGAVMSTGAEPISGLCGGYLGDRGELVVTDITAQEYPAQLDIFPEGSYHIYDYLFFFTNLKQNVADRTAAYLTRPAFEDVKDGAWYEDAVQYVSDKGLMTGTGGSTFSPDRELTRAQLVTILWRMEGEPAGEQTLSFSDVVSDTWYTNAVQWATSEGIVTGYSSGAFGPGDSVTREQFAAILYRYAQLKDVDVSVGEDTNILSYDDVFSISQWAMEAMQWACGAGIIQGVTDTAISPKTSVSRAQAAVMLMRFDQLARAQSPLSLWTDTAAAKEELTTYMAAITDPSGPDYIPPADRIAVFDLDGTLFCETDPNYFDYTLLKYRVLEDPDYKDKASDFEKEVANKIKEQNETGKSLSGLEVDHGKAVVSAFSGMTVAEFNDYIQKFKQQPMPSYEGMTRGEGWYLPMLQVVDYLKENDFTVYIVSGTDIVRGIACDSPLDLPNRQIIGSDETIVSSNQGDADGLNYVFAEGDHLILGGDFLIKNLKMNKVSVIMQEIGQQPVLSFGNSTGDSSMAEYVTSGNPCRSLAFMLCCDDTVRENGSESKAQKMFELCEEYDWVPISMKNDWSTIYGEGVRYIPSENP